MVTKPQYLLFNYFTPCDFSVEAIFWQRLLLCFASLFRLLRLRLCLILWEDGPESEKHVSLYAHISVDCGFFPSKMPVLLIILSLIQN